MAGLDESWVPTVLALFGVGALIGTAVGGRIADAHLFGTLFGGITASTVVLTVLALTAHSPVAAVALSLMLGLHGLLHGPRAQRPDVQRRERRPDAGGRDHDGRLQHRQHGGPLARRPGHRRGLGLPGVAWTGAALAGAGIVTTASRRGCTCGGGVSRDRGRRPTATPARRRRRFRYAVSRGVRLGGNRSGAPSGDTEPAVAATRG